MHKCNKCDINEFYKYEYKFNENNFYINVFKNLQYYSVYIETKRITNEVFWGNDICLPHFDSCHHHLQRTLHSVFTPGKPVFFKNIPMYFL